MFLGRESIRNDLVEKHLKNFVSVNQYSAHQVHLRNLKKDIFYVVRLNSRR
jgi:hypothetical protein